MTTAPPVPPPLAGEAGRPPSGSRPDQAPVPSPEAPKRHRLRYAVVGAILVGSLAFLLVKGLGSALDFYLPANQAVQQEASLAGKTFNIEGVVEPGSIHPTHSGVNFVVTAGSTKVQVDNSGSPPELFQNDIPVIAVGHFVPDSTNFVSDQILVKHSASYIAAHPGRVTAPNGTRR